MEDEKTLNPRPVFQNQPILCPWITCQPYPSTQVIKNKLNEFIKKYGSSVNSSLSKKTCITDSLCLKSHITNNSQSSSTHFFYFLRLMQLFPDTHPATLHTVLTLSNNNFFYAIDKLLYAKKCKCSIGDRQNYPIRTGRGRGAYSSSRGRNTCNRSVPPYQPVTRTITDDLAEVQRIIGLAEKPYIEMQSISTEDSGVTEEQDITDNTHQVVNICVDNSDQILQENQTYVDAENQEVIKIVCFGNDHQMVEQQKMDEAMELEAFCDNSAENDIRIENDYDKESESEPAVIVVDTINDLDESNAVNESHLIESHDSNQLHSADFTNNLTLDEESKIMSN